MPEELSLATPRGRIAARAWGPPAGPHVLAVHGWLDNAASFDHLAPLLPRLRIVAIDLPGHGRSDHAPSGDLYPFVDHVAALHAAKTALGWDHCALLGHSLGAGVCSIYAGAFPDTVVALGLIEGLGPLSEEPKHAPERLAKSLTEQLRKHGRAAPVYPTADAAARLLATTASKLQPRSIETLLARGLQPAPQGVTWCTDPRLRIPSRLRLTEAQVLAFLGAIACPTLLVVAASGYPFVPSEGTPRVQAVPQIALARVVGGHHVHLDDPGPVAALLQPLLAGR